MLQTFMENRALQILVLWGWRRYLLAFLSGCLSALALPPFYMFPFLLPSFCILVWLLDGLVRPYRWEQARIFSRFIAFLKYSAQALAIGWFFGFGRFLLSLFWTGAIFSETLGFGVWMSPFMALFQPAVLGIISSVGIFISALLWSSGSGRIVSLATGIMIGDWLTAAIPFIFPPLGFGASLGASDIMLQGASLVGVVGLSFFCVLIFASPAVMGCQKRPSDKRWYLPAVSICLLLFILIHGFCRISKREEAQSDSLRIRLVQANVPGWSTGDHEDIFSDYIRLSGASTSPSLPGIEGVTHLVWPGLDGTFFPLDDPEIQTSIKKFLPPGTVLVTGGLNREVPETGTEHFLRDSLLVFGEGGDLISVYDRVNGRSFGFFSLFLEPLEKVRINWGAHILLLGSGRDLIPAGTSNAFLPLVRHEGFLSSSFQGAGGRARWALNVSSDYWFPSLTGATQFVHRLRFQALEQGIPVVRAANRGISVVIDSYGHVVDFLPPDAHGILDFNLPETALPPPFSRFGNPILLLIFLVGLLFSFYYRINNA